MAGLFAFLIFIFIMIFMTKIFIMLANSFSGKSNRVMKYSARSFLYAVLGFMVLIVLFVNYSNSKTDGGNQSADGFTIEKYVVKLDVSNKNVVTVNEELTVNFYEAGHHGIYRFIPSWLEYTGKDNKTLSRYSLISDLRAFGDDYTVDTVKNKKRIKIGNPYRTLSTGLKTYYINYTYEMGEDPFNGFDEFIFHAFGDYWGTNINNASLEIKMPTEVDKDNIKFFADKHREKDITSYVDYYVMGDTIYATVSGSYFLKTALTVDVLLPEGYFAEAKSSYGYTSMLFCLLIIAFAIISFITWFKHGKDLDKYPETVEFYPPNGLDASELGYIYKSDGGRKLTIALIVELASKKIIKIEDKDHAITITNLYPKDYKNGKEDDKNLPQLTENERVVYNALFNQGNLTVLSGNTEFYKAFSDVTENLNSKYDELINDVVAYKKMKTTAQLFFISTLLFLAAYSFIKDMDPKFSFLYPIAFVSILVIFVLSVLMKRRSDTGEQLVAKARGFKNYLETAEKEDLKHLVDENAYYFFNILPYAYVFGISKKWIEKFEQIPIPVPDEIGFDYTNTYLFDDISSNISYPTSSGSSGSSGCGGGCSSCGGGCSSCGGGGSW